MVFRMLQCDYKSFIERIYKAHFVRTPQSVLNENSLDNDIDSYNIWFGLYPYWLEIQFFFEQLNIIKYQKVESEVDV